MALTDARAYYGLTATGELSRTGSAGPATVGTVQTPVVLTGATIGYCVRMVLVGNTTFVELDLSDATIIDQTAFVAGTAQVETATITAASGCTSNGTMTLVLTSSGMTGSPLNVPVALTTAAHTSASLIAAAARTALSEVAVIAARFTVGGSGANITFTRLPTTVGGVDTYPANDVTLNLAIPSGLGVTAAATSADTTAGVATSGPVIFDEGVDFEGRAVANAGFTNGMLLQVTAGTGACVFSDDETNRMPLFSGCSNLWISPTPAEAFITVGAFTAISPLPCEVTITKLGPPP